MRRILKLDNAIQRYAWGSRTAIRELLGRPGPAEEPEAELWLGAHPKSPSRVLVDDAWRPLDEMVAADPEGILGARLAARSERTMPFLLKVLAAARPLSIQAHPDAERARAGFARDEARGLAADDRRRNYRDPRPKPELLYALGPEPFRVMRGFRPAAEILSYLDRLGLAERLPGVDRLRRAGNAALPRFFAECLELDATRAAPVIATAVEGAATRADDDACAWVGRLAEAYPGDVGVLGPLLMNVFELAPGEALYTPPGTIHAYLEGTGIELMTSSDNVLRGGLTGKHVDVGALVEVVDFDAPGDGRLRPEAGGVGEERFRVPAAGLELARIELGADEVHERDVDGVEILLATAGAGSVIAGDGEPQPLGQGDSVLVPAGVGRYFLRGPGVVFRAAAP